MFTAALFVTENIGNHQMCVNRGLTKYSMEFLQWNTLQSLKGNDPHVHRHEEVSKIYFKWEKKKVAEQYV